MALVRPCRLALILRCGLLLILSLGVTTFGADDEQSATVVEKTIAQLSDPPASRLAQKALSLHPSEWKHGETQNFIYHYQQLPSAKAVASEAEFYYRVIAKELQRETKSWERKSHIFLFESPAEWAAFRTVGGLEPWTGALHSQGDLFLPRGGALRPKGNSLAHEVTHLIVHRFFGAGVPLWLNEGLAEYTATRWYASYWRSRGYNSRPVSISTNPAHFIPLATLTTLASYPETTEEVMAFYSQSERLVRFLSSQDKPKFAEFLELLSKGARFETALDTCYGRRFLNLAALERDFKPYATRDFSE